MNPKKVSRRVARVVANREQLLRLLPRIIYYAERSQPASVIKKMDTWYRALEDMRCYVDGQSPTVIASAHGGHLTRQAVDNRIKDVAKEVLSSHPEILDALAPEEQATSDILETHRRG